MKKDKSWPVQTGSDYGAPGPAYVWPAAYVNKQAAEYPQGHTLPPCLIPPPEVIYSAPVLTVGGASIVLPIPSPLPVAYLRVNQVGVTFTGSAGPRNWLPETLAGDPATKLYIEIENGEDGPDAEEVFDVRVCVTPNSLCLLDPNSDYLVKYHKMGYIRPSELVSGAVLAGNGYELSLPPGGWIDITGPAVLSEAGYGVIPGRSIPICVEVFSPTHRIPIISKAIRHTEITILSDSP